MVNTLRFFDKKIMALIFVEFILFSIFMSMLIVFVKIYVERDSRRQKLLKVKSNQYSL
jgi:hypothetical protein